MTRFEAVRQAEVVTGGKHWWNWQLRCHLFTCNIDLDDPTNQWNYICCLPFDWLLQI